MTLHAALPPCKMKLGEAILLSFRKWYSHQQLASIADALSAQCSSVPISDQAGWPKISEESITKCRH
jgi:hypothetical protein